MNVSSKSLEKVVESFASLPGIGSKTAMRFALYLLNNSKEKIMYFSNSIKELAENVFFCNQCHNITDTENALCSICASENRDSTVVCIVESLRDLLAIEKTGTYKGLYHLLSGVISPIDGISPTDLNIETLISRVSKHSINELIFALPTTMEGDTTCFYIYKKLKDVKIKISTLARGISIGDELEYIDELTIAKSMSGRIPFEQSISSG